MSQSFTPNHVNPVQWQQTLGLARSACARIFRDGGAPVDALVAFGLDGAPTADIDWSTAVDRIASSICMPQVCQTKLRRAA
jgi:hypothetical protein